MNQYFFFNFFIILGKFTEPIYENVPLPWNSKEVRSRTSSVQSAPEIKSPPSKLPQQVVQPVKGDNVLEKQNDLIPVKNNGLDISSNSNVLPQVTPTTLIAHSAEQSFGKYNNNKVFNYSSVRIVRKILIIIKYCYFIKILQTKVVVVEH